MSDPFLGEIKMMSFSFPPRGWALCNGQLLPINQNQALFSLLGTTYGGDGRVTFALPNLQGRLPMHVGGSFSLGQAGGETAHTLNAAEMPSHTHQALAAGAASQASPGNAAWADGGQATYAEAPTGVMGVGALLNTGGSQPHENRPPFLTVSFCIAMQGIFPSRD